MENIDKFNGHATKILARLYESFPEVTDLDCREFVHGIVPPENVHVDELQEATRDPQIRFCAAALKWLHETGYFKGDAALHYVRVHRAVLTPQGFEAMAATPTSLDGKGPIGAQLAELAKDAGKEGFKKQVADLIGIVIGVGVRSALGS